jgi:Tol biopolymer transport system component
MIVLPREFSLPDGALEHQRRLVVAEVAAGRQRSRLTARRGVAVAAVILVGGLLVAPAFGLGSRLLQLIRGDAPRTPEVSAPVWSPDGRRIAVKGWNGSERNYDVYVLNADGSGQRNVTHDLTLVTDPGRRSSEGGPVWSPDGRKLLFGRDPGFNVAEILVMNADGSGQRRLTSGSGPVWSPDGRLIAYGAAGLYVMNADGRRKRLLAQNAVRPAWSPDGRKIAFVSNRDGDFDVYVMNADGSGHRRLTRNAASHSRPVWSPDGKKIAFTSDRNLDGRASEIYVMNADGSGQRRLTPHAYGAVGAWAWSPDGRRIAFVSRRHGKAEVYLINADGSGEQNLTRNPARDADPAWSPDGRKLLFVSDRGDGIYALYVMNADGSGQRRLTQRG